MLYEKITYLDDFPININIASITEYPIHFHQDVELVYVLKGTVELKNGYCNYLLKEGDIFTNSGHEVHSLMKTEKENIVAIIQASNYFFTKYFPNLSNSCYRTYVNNESFQKLDNLRKMLLSILINYSKKSFNYKSDCIRMMVDIIKYLNENFNLFTFEEQVVVNFKNDNPITVDRISRIITYVYKNYANKITLEDLAEMEHLSTYYLSHLIRQYTGMNFREFLCFARVEMSEIDLLDTQKKISAIARDAGFSTTLYYEKFFKKWFKVSPEEHRKLNQPYILSSDYPANMKILSANLAITILKRLFSAVTSYETNTSIVNCLQLNINITSEDKEIMNIKHDVIPIITLDDYNVMGINMIQNLNELGIKDVILSTYEEDNNQDIHDARQYLCDKGFRVNVVPTFLKESSFAYGYDSIAALITVFKDNFIENRPIQFKLRDQGDTRKVLKGMPSSITSNLIRKPSLYAYGILSNVKGSLVQWGKYYSVIKCEDGNELMYLIVAYNYNENISKLCLNNVTVYETYDILNDFNDELSLDFNFNLEKGQYIINKYVFSNENTLFNYMYQLGFPEDLAYTFDWTKSFNVHPYTTIQMENVKDNLNINLTLNGAGFQVAAIFKQIKEEE